MPLARQGMSTATILRLPAPFPIRNVVLMENHKLRKQADSFLGRVLTAVSPILVIGNHFHGSLSCSRQRAISFLNSSKAIRMKTFISILFISVTLSCFSAEPNFRIRFQDQFSSLRGDCRALSSGVMLAAGERGRMIRSTDNGEHWRAVEVNSFAHFTRMDFADNLRGVIADDSGRVWLTTDAGATWQITFTADQPLTSIALAGAQTVIAVGQSGGVWRGNIATNEWKRVSAGLDSVKLDDVAFSGQRGVIMGAWGTMAITTDGGESWSKFTLPTYQTYYKCGFITPDLALITGRDTAKGASRFYRYDYAASRWDTINPGHYRQIIDFAAISPTDILTVGQGGLMMHSYDSARTWKITDTLTFDFTPNGYRITSDVFCISILPDGRGLATGGNVGGTVATTTDHGQTWTIRTEAPGSLEYLLPYDGFAHSTDSVIIVGGYRKRIYRTSDGGATWRRPYPASSFQFSYFYRVHFVSKARGYAVGQTSQGSWCYSTTSDGGETWSDIQQYGEYFTFPDAQHGYMTRFRGTPTSTTPIFFASKDSGATWSRKYFKDVGLTDSTGYGWIGIPHFATANKGATIISAANRATFYYTEDYGETWERRFLFDSTSGIEHTKWKSENTVFAYGRRGELQRSDDGGRHWRVLNSGLTSLSGILFLNDSVAIAAGYDGTVAVSTNGGEIWHKVATPAKKTSFEVDNNFGGENYQGMCRVDDTTAYLLGTSRIVRVVVTTDKAVGVSEALPAPELLISPNPASESFTVHCPENAHITIRDVLGRVRTISAEAVNGEAVISTSDWASGVYIVEVFLKNSGKCRSGQIVISR